ncbi:hypothetical protein [Streptomyces violascens]|uniref:hypothetical protein n=1 Tax=Streptomyces violascens TaxID=67381 RepID=UPI0036AA3E8E
MLSIADVIGHEIESSVWYTANTRWLLYGMAAGGDDEDVRYVSCVWEMKVLFSASGEEEAPTLLTPSEPVLPDTADARCMEIMKTLRVRFSRITQRALRNQLMHSTGQRLIAQSIAASMPTLDIATSVNQAALDRLVAGLPKLPKLDVSGLLPQLDLSYLTPKIDYSHLFPPPATNQFAAAAFAKELKSPDEDEEEAPLPDEDDSSDPEARSSEADDPDTEH